MPSSPGYWPARDPVHDRDSTPSLSETTACWEPNAQMPRHSAHGPGRDRIKSGGSSARTTLYQRLCIMSEHKTSNLDASNRKHLDDMQSEDYAVSSDSSMSVDEEDKGECGDLLERQVNLEE